MDDIARQLPDPPPPRPAGRTAAIATAMARFDGAAPVSAVAARPARWQIGHAPAAALASIVLVALIGIPVALLKPTEPVSAPPQTVAFDASPKPTQARDRAPLPSPALASPALAPNDAKLERPSAPVTPTAQVDTAVASVSAPPPEPVMAAPAPPPPPMAYAAAPQAKVAPSERAAMADGVREDIVVTGSRVSRAAIAAAKRGDWNACTVDDPAQSLRGCGEVTRARKAEVAAALSEGLTQAWQSDWDAAITAFDAAIALQPKLGLAYLNRGLAYQHSGNMERATADLDLAVRYAPSARSYYARARLRRAGGNIRGAQADEARAIEHDPDYAAILEN